LAADRVIGGLEWQPQLSGCASRWDW